MRKTLILFVIVVAAGIAAWKLTSSRGDGSASYDTSMSAFAIEDIRAVKRIFLVDKGGNRIDLKQKGEGWIVNDRYPADQGSVDLLLKGMQKLEIQYIPPKAAAENILKTMAAFAIQVEIFGSRDRLLKKYFIGGMTQDERGTYFLMDGADQAYVMQVPGFVGNLRERFRPELGRFRSQKFLQFDPADVARVSAAYPGQQENSFRLEAQLTGYLVYGGEGTGSAEPQKAVKGKAEAYLDRLQRLACEAYLTDDIRRDSVTAGTPFCTLEIGFRNGEKNEVSFWQKIDPNIPDQPVNRFFILKDNEFMLGQYEVIKEAFRNGAYFTH
jgi:hypothetical protein